MEMRVSNENPDARESIDIKHDPVDLTKISPWTIKAFPVETRKAIVRAAEIEGVSVGQWIEHRVREWQEQTGFQTRFGFPISDSTLSRASGSPGFPQAPNKPIGRSLLPNSPPPPAYRRVPFGEQLRLMTEIASRLDHAGAKRQLGQLVEDWANARLVARQRRVNLPT
jgi:hypothetical protein